jgi:tetratricopeptide (TPR) repeat protein
MHAAGKALEGYRAAPDQSVAFETLANTLVWKKQADLLSQVVQEHARAHGGKAERLFFSGELHMLRGQFAAAEKDFAAALAKVPQRDQWKYKNALSRAKIKQGKTVALYLDSGKSTRTFQDLAHLCVQEKNPDQLQELLAVHRQEHPDDDALPGFELDILWLKSDYAGALKFMEEKKQALQQRDQWKFEGYLVRCLIKLKRTEEAVKEAERIVADKIGGDRRLLVLAHAATGDVKKTMAAVARFDSDRYFAQDCYRDPDLGPILRSQAFQPFRQRYPEEQLNPDPVDDLDD